jgi:serine/threonine protein phosphatase PrpC
MVVLPDFSEISESGVYPSDVRNPSPSEKHSSPAGCSEASVASAATQSTDVTLSRYSPSSGSDEHRHSFSRPPLIPRYSSGTLSTIPNSVSDPGGCRVIIGHVGDCRAVLCDGGVSGLCIIYLYMCTYQITVLLCTILL